MRLNISLLVALIASESCKALTIPSRPASFVAHPKVTFSSQPLFASRSNDDEIVDKELTAREARITAPLSALATALSFYPNNALAYEAEEKAKAREANRAKIRAARSGVPPPSPVVQAPPAPPAPAPAPVVQLPTKFELAAKRYFPGAMKSSGVTSTVSSVLKKRGYQPSSTLLGSSLCSDEINYKPEALVNQMQKKLSNGDLGGVFNMGGLGGIPFAGTTGFSAFVSHCPGNGKIVFLYGPHVGISEDGVVGKVKRIGVDKESTSCGAAVGALKAIEAQYQSKPKGNQTNVDVPGPKGFDFQQEFIVDNLRSKLGDLATLEAQGGDQTLAFTTSKVFSIIQEVVLAEIRKKTKDPAFWSKVSEVAIVGGIVINRDPNAGEDYFQPLSFKGFEKDKEFDLYDEGFGADISIPDGLAIRMREMNMKIN